MSFNQSRPERSKSFQYRKSNRSGTSAQPRNLSGGIGKGGGGPAPPPSSTSTNSSLSSNRSFKKSNNAQGGQSRVSSVGVNPDPNYASAARTTQNGARSQPSVHGAADAPLAWVPVKPTTDMPTQKITQAVPKAPSSQPAIVNSDSTPPATPAKGEASKSFPLQSGSISPGFVNGMQIPARTNTAPPNLDKQQRDQVRHDSQRTVQPFPIPSVPKKQLPRKAGDAGNQSNTGEAHQMSKPKRNVQFSSASPVTQTQKTSVHHIPGVFMPMPFHQPQVPVQLGGPKPPIQLQGMAATSLPVPMPMHMSMPLPMGNAQLQQSVFVPNLQPHPMQPQGIMHQGQRLNFPPQMGPHMPPQLGNLGISIGPPFAQHQAGKYSVQRKPVIITHPDTHEELRPGGSSGTRSHPNVPQSQPIPSIPPAQSINYYSNSYELFLPSRQAVLTKSVPSDAGEAPVSAIPSVSEPILESEGEGTEYVNDGLVSLPPAASNDKPVVELSRSKSNAFKGKKKRKEFLQKADALGTTSDLYMAYMGPEEKNEIAASLNSITSTCSVTSKHELVDTAQDDIDVSKGKKKGKKKRKEFLQKADAYDIDVSKGKKKGKKKIKEILQKADALGTTSELVDTTQDDIVLKKAGQHKSEPDDWEDAADVSTPRLEAVDDGKQVRNEDGNGLMTKKYSRDFLLKFSEQCSELPEGLKIPSYAEALMASNLNASRESHPSIVDRQVMHKAEKKYEVGKITDEEVAKQRQLKAILNKLTPQNFEKLFEQVKEVNIDNTVTLTGVISQIFDKALMEPSFCEMYANFCYYLAGELPDFSEDNEKITFKRLLLNQCQEEFERDAREQEEADRADDEGDVKLSEGEREEKRIQARRRMLGNIRLIGELYKKKMLTEKIMHECIKQLLGEYQNPDEEDIEALCVLMSTIGEMIDHPKAKPFMDAYFDRMAKLSNNMNLSSRLRFMLKDSIDLRENKKWQQRRKLFEQVEEVNNDTFTTFGSNPAPTADVAVGPTLGPTHLTQPKKKKKRKEKLIFFENPDCSLPHPHFLSVDQTREREQVRHHPPATRFSGLPLHLWRPQAIISVFPLPLQAQKP